MLLPLEEAQPVEGAPAPAEPRPVREPAVQRSSEEDVLRHRLTHLPYQPCCRVCIAATAADVAHARREPLQDEADELDCAYGQLANLHGSTTFMVLVGIDKSKGYGMAVLAPSKGRDRKVVRAVVSYLQEAGHTTTLRLRTDSEPAIRSLAQEVSSQRTASTVLEVTPVGSSSSLGAGENYIRRMMQVLRSIVQEFEDRWSKKIPMLALEYGITHSAWLMNRYQIHRQEATPNQALQKNAYRGNLVIFGQTVMIRRSEDLTRLSPAVVFSVG